MLTPNQLTLIELMNDPDEPLSMKKAAERVGETHGTVFRWFATDDAFQDEYAKYVLAAMLIRKADVARMAGDRALGGNDRAIEIFLRHSGKAEEEKKDDAPLPPRQILVDVSPETKLALKAARPRMAERMADLSEALAEPVEKALRKPAVEEMEAGEASEPSGEEIDAQEPAEAVSGGL